MSRTRTAPHVCCMCSRQHRRGAKTFTVEGMRCAKNCTRKPIVAKPFPWVGKSACSFCGATTKRGVHRCANRVTCTTRALSKMTVLKYSDDWVRDEYAAATAVATSDERMAA